MPNIIVQTFDRINLFMQKIFSRLGTEQHKYRLAIRFASIFISNQSYEYPGVCYRIVLQRGTKKYTTNYFSLVLNTENIISQSVQVKATLFFDQEKQAYQQKKFDIVILRKDILEESPVAMFTLMAESCAGYRGERVVFRDSAHKVEAFMVCERIDGVDCGITASDRSSIDKSIEGKRKAFQKRTSRETSPIYNNFVNPQVFAVPPVGSSRVFTTEKSIIDQIRMNSETSVIYGELRKSQQRSKNQHLPCNQPQKCSHVVHFNHPQQGGYSVNSPPQSGSKVWPPSPKKVQIAQIPSNSQIAYDPRMLKDGQIMSPIAFTNPSFHPTNLPPSQSLLAQSPLSQQPPPTPSAPFVSPYPQTQPQYCSTPPLQAIRQNFRIQVTPPQSTSAKVERSELPSLGELANQRQNSKSPTFRDLINVDQEKIPTKKRSQRKNDVSREEVMTEDTTINQTRMRETDNEELLVNKISFISKDADSVKDTSNPLLSEITPVDSFVKPLPIQQLQTIPLTEPKEETFMSATFKNDHQNLYYEEFTPIKKELELEPKEVSANLRIEVENLSTLNLKLKNQTNRLQNQIFLREEFIREKQIQIQAQKQQINALYNENKELKDKSCLLQGKIIQVEGVNRQAIKQYDESITYQNQQLQELNKDLQSRLASALLQIERHADKNQEFQQRIQKLSQQKDYFHKQNTQLTNKIQEMKQNNARIGIDNVSLGGINAELKTKVADLIFENKELRSKILKLQQQLSQLHNKNGQPNPQMHRLTNQMQRIQAYNRNSIGEMQELRAEQEQLNIKHKDLIQKYLKNFKDLTENKNARQQLQKQLFELQTQLQIIIKSKDDEIQRLHQVIKQMQSTLVDPNTDPSYNSMHIKMMGLNEKVQMLTMQNSQQRILYKKDLDTKSGDLQDLTQKFNQNQKILNQTIAIWTLKEKSLSEAITVRDRRIAQLQNNRSTIKSETTIKNSSESDRRQLLVKIQQLTGELERLKELDQEIAVVESMNKDLEAQVAQSNKRISLILQFTYRENPALAKQLAKIKV